MLGDCFSVLVILILHRFDLALHASFVMIYLYSMFLLFFNKKKNWGRKCREFYFFVSWHVRYCMYFCLICQFIVH
jgi:hypothetical protein